MRSTVKTEIYSATATASAGRHRWRSLPWSQVSLLFFMISAFLISATTGINDLESLPNWSAPLAEVFVGAAIFSLAAIILVWAGRMLPKNL